MSPESPIFRKFDLLFLTYGIQFYGDRKEVAKQVGY